MPKDLDVLMTQDPELEADLLAFVTKVAANRYGITHAEVVEEARRLLDPTLPGDCDECGGAGFFGDGPIVEPCGYCRGKGEAVLHPAQGVMVR